MSARRLMAVFQDRDGNWVATIKQGCITERHVVIKRSQNCIEDQKLRREATRRAKELV